MTFRRALAALALLALISPPLAASVRITIVNTNNAGEGFNDPTPATPVGGNSGTTVGEQRLKALQYAADLWGALLDSPVDIRIEASFEPLACDAASATLGEAGPSNSILDFKNAPVPGTWYPVALANRLAGEDLIPTAGGQIRARFNSKIGTTGCLENGQWYYGLDDNHGDKLDLVTVLLHELGHGLGFLTLVDTGSGAEFLGHPDIFESHILDTSTNRHWDEMTEAERMTSTINTGRVVWDGIAVEAAVPATLEGLPVLTVTAPAAAAGDYSIGTAEFGAQLTAGAISGALVQAIDPSDAAGAATTDGCSPLSNAAEMAGQVALVDRGTCRFVVKAKNVQNAGAIGMVVVDNVAESPPPQMAGSDATVTIPSVIITQADGNTIEASLPAGVSVELRIHPRLLAGASIGNRMLLYAPNPADPGSSISHWDSSARPDLLMEPSASPDLPHAVDLTLPLLRDIGWLSDAIPGTAPRQPVELVSPEPPPRAVAPRP